MLYEINDGDRDIEAVQINTKVQDFIIVQEQWVKLALNRLVQVNNGQVSLDGNSMPLGCYLCLNQRGDLYLMSKDSFENKYRAKSQIKTWNPININYGYTPMACS